MNATSEVLIRGSGVAACCCAHLLRDAGIRVAMESSERPRIPAVMLSDAALALIRDVFGNPTLFAGSARIDQRVVSWGNSAEPVSLPHSAVVVSEQVLLESLSWGFESDAVVDPGFVIHASRPLPPGVDEKPFGSRCASAAEVVLKDPDDSSSCRIESLADGWLFLIPNAAASTWLLAVGARPEVLIAQSRLIAPRIEVLRSLPGEFSACPKIVTPLCGRTWLTCGAAAIGFDPICGDGTAQAVREAILASAVVRAIADGGDEAALFVHYEARLTAAMLRHLTLCEEFYRTGGSGDWWKTEAASLSEGRRWCETQQAGTGPPRYQLRDFVLECRT